MHPESMTLMREFVEKYVGAFNRKVLDVGAIDINGAYKELFDDHWYTGMDLVKGRNVDIVGWENVFGVFYDVVICGQVFEHCVDMKQLASNIGRAMYTDGLCCIIAPTQASKHREPDLWRFTAGGMRQLLKWAGCEVLEAFERGRDACGIGRKV